MTEPRVPGERTSRLELPCGETVALDALDMGMREYPCGCGDRHAVVMDMHPLSRFVPEALAEALDATVETTDGTPFGMMHLMGMVLEEFPERVAAADASENGDLGFALVWLTDFDARRLHEVAVELLVELMDHAISHADDDAAVAEFEEQLQAFDVAAFVDAYRDRRDFADEYDTPV